MKRKKYKPGPGWFRYAGSPVWEHKSGVRVHVSGIFLIPGTWTKDIPYSELSRYRRICAGNNKRGIMAWAKDNII